MSYEYSSSGQNFIFPNPLRQHNYFIASASAITGFFGLILLFQARSALHDADHVRALSAALIALLLIAAAGYLLFGFFDQLRFFFGRGRPMGLAPQLQPDQLGTSQYAENYLKETLRQQALEYPEPADPLSNLLYFLIPDLIYAPRPVRGFAERQFQAGILTMALLMGLVMSAILGNGRSEVGSHVSSWTAVILFAIAAPNLWNPKAGGAGSQNGLSILSVPKMAALAGFCVLGPVLLSLFGNALPASPFGISTGILFLLLSMTAILHILFFAAVIRHRLQAPSTTVSMTQDTWNISVNPALISAEFMRAMQEGWWEKIPNRRYCRIDPAVNLQQQSGQFQGSMVEETQPIPFVINGKDGDRPFASGNPFIITTINSYGLLLTLVASVTSFLLVSAIANDDHVLGSLLVCALFFAVLARAAFNVARFLTLRFDFRSQLIWMEMDGSYNAAKVGQGNLYTSQFHSSSQIVQIEGMTFRLWVAEIHSVTFGKDGQRFILSMLGKPDVATALTQRLKSFITSQAVFAAINSEGDQERTRSNTRLGPDTNPRFGAFPPPFKA